MIIPFHFYKSIECPILYVNIIINGRSHNSGRRVFMKISKITEKALSRITQSRSRHICKQIKTDGKRMWSGFCRVPIEIIWKRKVWSREFLFWFLSSSSVYLFCVSKWSQWSLSSRECLFLVQRALSLDRNHRRWKVGNLLFLST